ncbi:MAG TPA: DUF2252 domain-containing protein [Solirubrobacteraceae bacterium]|jgi:uncharacterized protein (DUF2252 family)|nr:DUF2252 domain-containing protein [Solirubrobacteraceae bacterium]
MSTSQPNGVTEREAIGKTAREHTPRSAHGDWQAAEDREDPIAALEAQGTSRVQELLPIRYGRMATSAFAFFRGAAAVMAADLAKTPASGLRVQLCGDAHLSNFGIFASPEREMLFDINDFDETLPGPWEWDVKRLAASMAIAGRERGLSAPELADVLAWTGQAYRQSMRGFAQMSNLDVWYAKLNVKDIVNIVREQQLTGGKRLAKMEQRLGKARSKNSTRAVMKLTESVEGKLRFVSEPPLIVPIEELFGQQESDGLRGRMQGLLGDYRDSLGDEYDVLFDNYSFEGMARKVVGVGSVGTRAWVLLMVGRDDGDPLVLQAKEAQASVLEPYAGASAYANSGQRVVEGQRLMQAAGDIFLGWLPARGIDEVQRDFYVRQLWDGKLSVEVEELDYKLLRGYGALCAWTLARAHARSGDRIAIAAYLGKGGVFDQAIAEFAEAYADQNERDHADLLAAIESGRLSALDA